MAEIDLERYEPMDPAVQQDPFPVYAVLRRQAPVYRHPRTGVFFVSRLETVKRVLADPETFSSRGSNAATRPSPGLLAELRRTASGGERIVDTMITADPPRHTRYRRPTARVLSARRMRVIEPVIRSIASDLLDAWPAKGRIDVMNRFSVPYPVRVIAHVLGLKPGQEDDIKRWSDDSVVALGADVADERRLSAARGMLELQRMWVEEIARRRDQPGDDVVSELLEARIQGDDGALRPLDVPELVSIFQQLMIAGNETTTKLVNELVRLLAENPDEWRALRESPDRIPRVVEEGLRLSSPNQGLYRQVVREVELDGVTLPAGSTVWVMFGAANRDESVFEDPDRFDPGRERLGDHVAFGFGPHFCVGAPLARLEARVALEEMARRVEQLRIPDGMQLRYEPSFILRGLDALEIER